MTTSKILLWLEPHFELARPGIMKTWRGWFERIAQALHDANESSETLIAMLDPADTEDREADRFCRTVKFSHAELRANWALDGDPFETLECDRTSKTAEAELGRIVIDRLAGFVPDFVFLHNENTWLRRLFPDAVFINIELTWISRNPYPQLWHLDIAGAGKGRVLAENFGTAVESIDISGSAGTFLDELSAKLRFLLRSPAAESAVNGLRKRFSRVVLLPLGIYPRPDGAMPVSAAIDKFLERQSGNTVFLLTQHPMQKVLGAEQVAYLIRKYPYVVDAAAHESQRLLPLVDEVVGDFSTIATQALIFGVPLLSIAETQACHALGNPLARILASASRHDCRRALLWLLTRYSINEGQLFDGRFLSDFMCRAAAARAAGDLQAAYRPTLLSIDAWQHTTWAGATPPASDLAPPTLKQASLPHSIHASIKAILATLPPDGPNTSISSPTPTGEPTPDPEDSAQYERAKTAIAGGDIGAGGDILIDLASRGTSLWEVYYDLAAIALQQGDLAAAVDLLETAIARESRPGKSALGLARVHVISGEHEKALAALSPYLRAHPDDFEGLDLLRETLGLAPALSAIAWARLLADLRYEGARAKAHNAEYEKAVAAIREALAAARPTEGDRPQLSPLAMRLKGGSAAIRRANPAGDADQGDPFHAISPRCEMYAYARSKLQSDDDARNYYFTSGQNVADHLYKYLRQEGIDPAKLTALDFACGYGRVTRWLSKIFARTSASDLEPSMIEFVGSRFGVDTFLSDRSPEAIAAMDRRFDVVFVFSLFTHLPEASWRRWSAALFGLLNPGGYLLFSTHSYQLFATLDPTRYADPASWQSDYVFWRDNETKGRLSTDDYGGCIVTPRFVESVFGDIPGAKVARHFKMGEFDRYHDIYAIRRGD